MRLLPVGVGTLACLRFVVNGGATVGMTTSLAIEDGTASGQHEVNLAWNQSVTHPNGVVYVVSLTDDTDSDGLPDWWEELYFEGPTRANAAMDSEREGITNGQAYPAGTNPLNAASVLRVIAITLESGRLYSFHSREPEFVGSGGTDILGAGEVSEVLDPSTPSVSARYYRILVVW